jgi:type I restriction enzyme R subunit
VLRAIENSVSLKERNYAIIADEAHSSQTGSTARQLKEVLMVMVPPAMKKNSRRTIFSMPPLLHAALQKISLTLPSPRHQNQNARTVWPPTKPDEPASKTNKPEAFHVYSMRQAIEEGFILDVLKNYTNYKVAYNLAMKMKDADQEVESKKAKVKLNQWVRLHDHNISQKVMVIVEHFKTHVMGLLVGKRRPWW